MGLFLRIAFKLHETPRWLISQGRIYDAAQVLSHMAYQNGKVINIDIDELDQGDIDERTSWTDFWKSREWTADLIKTGILLCIIWMGTSLGFGMFGSFLTVFLKNGAKLSVDETYLNYLIISACNFV